jgi:osmotically-inducible protein OsmY
MQMTDDELRIAVEEELDWDPRLDSGDIAVSASAGTVTLRGRVGAYTEKCEATSDAQRVRGVARVLDDELVVALLDEYCSADITLRQYVLQALALNDLVPSSINPEVDAGWVTLSGTATSHFERAEAEHSVARVRGVRGVSNDVRIVPLGRSREDVTVAIAAALGRNARVESSSIRVTGSSGTVTLGGSVRSCAERAEAVLAAWSAAGVVNVIDDLRVTG